MSETVKEIEITGSPNDDNWYAKCIGQRFEVIDPAWWTTFTAPDDCYYVEHPENDDDTVCYVLISDCKVTKSVAQSAIGTTEILNEVKADKGILTEEELNKEFDELLEGFAVDDYVYKTLNRFLNSHKALFSANAELSFKNMNLELENEQITKYGKLLESLLKISNPEALEELKHE